MNKDDLKSLVNEIYKNLLNHIDLQKNPTKAQVISYLQEAANVVSDINGIGFISLEQSKHAFANGYKDIATEGIFSYQETNERFKEISFKHEATIKETRDVCENSQINLDSITKKFDEIQQHMISEVQNANLIIASLTKKVAELEKTSNIDSLTQVYNRYSLVTYLDEICSKKEINYELHLLMLDLDDFKAINDTHGHLAGDKILIFISNILRKTLRDGDKIFRYGGEEFIIVLNRIDDEECKQITQRILKLVNSNNLIYNGQSLRVTVSIGATKYLKNDTPDDLISRADKALYKAKENGKNQAQMDMNNGI